MPDRVLVTCPPMIRSIDRYRDQMRKANIEAIVPDFIQTMSEEELIAILGQYDGWIIGDDPATERVFEAGVEGRLRAAVKWGVGVDNVDFKGALAHGLEVNNTPGMFGDEVADVAHGYVIALARDTFSIDRGVREQQWLKPVGISLLNKAIGIVGFGNIGAALAERSLASKMEVHIYEPGPSSPREDERLHVHDWPNELNRLDFLVLCCSLTHETHHLINESILARCKPGIRIVNVSRGPLIDEAALCEALKSRCVHSAALEVFDTEPLPAQSELRQFPQCLFGSHNASNTQEAVDRTSFEVLRLLSLALAKSTPH